MNARGPAPKRRGDGLRGLLSYRRDKVGMMLALMRRQGDVARTRIGSSEMVLVTHPRDIRRVMVLDAARYRQSRSYEHLKPFVGDGLVTSDGERWAAQRHRTLASMRTLDLAPLFERAGRRIAARFDGAGAEPVEAAFDLVAETRRLSMTIARSVVLGADRPLDGRTFRADFDQAYAYVLRRIEALAPAPAWLPTRSRRRFRTGKAGLDAAIASALGHEVPGDGPRDLVTALLAEGARTDGGVLGDEVLTLLLAGYETTASALAWAVLLLCEHPEAWEAVGAEVAARCGDGLPSYADLNDLRFTRAVVQETLRLFPPIWAFSREATVPHELRGVAIPAGARIAISPYCTHRRPDFWERPEEFDPGRFEGAASPGPAYLPFGVGPHHCLGNAIAGPAMVLVLALMARRFHLTGSETGSGRPEAGVILRPPKGTRVHVAAR